MKHIKIYVEPFYRAAATPEGVPQVGTGRPYAALLASTKREDILAARDMILASPTVVTPMTMMVLAIRLYDVGHRDDAVLWFYIAKDRFRSLAEVAVVDAPLLREATAAIASFNTLAGPAINGYAFCDVAKQQAARTKAIDWVEAHPYDAVFNDRLPARRGDRAAALNDAIRNIRADAQKERAYFDDPKTAADFAKRRHQNAADAKFCWR